MVVPHHVEVGRLRVGLDLLDALAAGDHAGDGRVLEAPRQRPRRHVHPRRYLLVADPLGLLELAPHVIWLRLIRILRLSACHMAA
jgi:hypothetical protein